ncbi:MAG TPA: nuclear transport factor 2 family protein, partial [Ideonella sp.]|nr:nuclear transport factor 2 family protein [Ideonella sp.]
SNWTPMNPPALSPALQGLVDRQEIHDCILRYCSGVDRFDREMLLSVYHDDAIDDHGAFVGKAADFVDWALAYHAKFQHGHKHYVLNHRCELDGDTAHTETYWLFVGNNRHAPASSLHTGRYLDRFEKRGGRWAIAARKCIIEGGGSLGDMPVPEAALAAYAATGVAARDRSDPSYQRPLTVTRAPQVLPF